MLARLNFTKAYGTKHSEIDREHQDIFAFVNELAAAIDKGRRSKCQKQLYKLAEKFKTHLHKEILHLQYSGYRDTGLHMRHHREIAEKMKNHCNNCQGDCDKTSANKCHEIITSIILDEIIDSDHHFIDHFQRRTAHEHDGPSPQMARQRNIQT